MGNETTTMTVRTVYPCCNKPARFRVWTAVSRERYKRVCQACDTRWSVVRRVVARPGVRLDILDWNDDGPTGPR